MSQLVRLSYVLGCESAENLRSLLIVRRRPPLEGFPESSVELGHCLRLTMDHVTSASLGVPHDVGQLVRDQPRLPGLAAGELIKSAVSGPVSAACAGDKPVTERTR